MKSVKTGAEVLMINSYVKDLSFKNPRAPIVYSKDEISPEVNVNIGINVTQIDNSVYEVEIVVDTEAKSNSGVVYSLKLVHAGLFELKNVSESLVEQTLYIDCPYLLFPFARNVISNVTMSGNFPPLMLNYVDFDKLYSERNK